MGSREWEWVQDLILAALGVGDDALAPSNSFSLFSVFAYLFPGVPRVSLSHLLGRHSGYPGLGQAVPRWYRAKACIAETRAEPQVQPESLALLGTPKIVRK